MVDAIIDTLPIKKVALKVPSYGKFDATVLPANGVPSYEYLNLAEKGILVEMSDQAKGVLENLLHTSLGSEQIYGKDQRVAKFQYARKACTQLIRTLTEKSGVGGDRLTIPDSHSAARAVFILNPYLDLTDFKTPVYLMFAHPENAGDPVNFFLASLKMSKIEPQIRQLHKQTRLFLSQSPIPKAKDIQLVHAKSV